MNYMPQMIQYEIDQAHDKAWRRIIEMNRAHIDIKFITKKYKIKVYVVDHDSSMRTKTTQFKLLE